MFAGLAARLGTREQTVAVVAVSAVVRLHIEEQRLVSWLCSEAPQLAHLRWRASAHRTMAIDA